MGPGNSASESNHLWDRRAFLAFGGAIPALFSLPISFPRSSARSEHWDLEATTSRLVGDVIANPLAPVSIGKEHVLYCPPTQDIPGVLRTAAWTGGAPDVDSRLLQSSERAFAECYAAVGDVYTFVRRETESGSPPPPSIGVRLGVRPGAGGAPELILDLKGERGSGRIVHAAVDGLYQPRFEKWDAPLASYLADGAGPESQGFSSFGMDDKTLMLDRESYSLFRRTEQATYNPAWGSWEEWVRYEGNTDVCILQFRYGKLGDTAVSPASLDRTILACRVGALLASTAPSTFGADAGKRPVPLYQSSPAKTPPVDVRPSRGIIIPKRVGAPGPATEPTPPAPFNVALSQGLLPVNLDFNSLLRRADPLDMVTCMKVFDRTRAMLPTPALSDVNYALSRVLTNNDHEARVFASESLSGTVQSRFAHLIVRDRRPFSGRTETRQILTLTPEHLVTALGASAEQVGEEVFKARASSLEDLLNRPAPHDYITYLGERTEATATSRLHAISPVVLTGSLHAYLIALFAEAGARAAALSGPAEFDRLVPGLRATAHQIEAVAKAELGKSWLAENPFAGAAAQYQFGMLNIGSYMDMVIFRLGSSSGELRGAVAAYEAFRTGIGDAMQLPPLPAQPTLQQIITAVTGAGKQVNATIAKLNQALDEANATIADLRAKADQLASEWARAGRAVATLAYTATGALIAGPPGALIGAILSLF